MRTVIVDSPNLGDYKLRKPLRAKLEAFDKLNEYNRLAGRPPLAAVRLYIDDFSDIARAVSTQSDKRRSIVDVSWRGLPVISEEGPDPGADAGLAPRPRRSPHRVDDQAP